MTANIVVVRLEVINSFLKAGVVALTCFTKCYLGAAGMMLVNAASEALEAVSECCRTFAADLPLMLHARDRLDSVC